MELADRMSTVEPYFFAKLGLRIAELKAEGKDVIRLDVGSPDLPPAPFIVDTFTGLDYDVYLYGVLDLNMGSLASTKRKEYRLLIVFGLVSAK